MFCSFVSVFGVLMEEVSKGIITYVTNQGMWIVCYRSKHSVDFTFSFYDSDGIEVEFHRPESAGLYSSF